MPSAAPTTCLNWHWPSFRDWAGGLVVAIILFAVLTLATHPTPAQRWGMGACVIWGVLSRLIGLEIDLARRHYVWAILLVGVGSIGAALLGWGLYSLVQHLHL